MAKFPVEMSDDEGQIDAINYLLSGPAGLGQNFSGFSSSDEAGLTINLNPPFTQAGGVSLNSTYNVSTVERLDDFLIKVTFATTYPNPFPLGSGLWSVGHGTFSDYINDFGQPIGVVTSTTTYVVIRLTTPMPATAPVTGGTISNNLFTLNHIARAYQTDCNAIVTVTGTTDRVFISGQTTAVVSFSNLPSTWTAGIEIQIKRYKALNENAISNTSYYNSNYILDEIVVRRSYVPSDLNVDSFGRFTLDTIVASIVDNPEPGYYLYTTEFFVGRAGGSTIQVDSIQLGLRSISVQLVKE